MSAHFEGRDGFLFLAVGDVKITTVEETIMFSNFDLQVSYDIEEIKEDMEKIKKLRKVFFIKTIFFIPSYFIQLLTFGKKRAKEFITVYKLTYKVVFNKITLKKYNQELTLIFKNSIMKQLEHK